MLEIDETALIEFFGALPQAQDLEEAEFFGASTWEVHCGNLRLNVMFSTYDHEVVLALYRADNAEPILKACIKWINAVRFRDNKSMLVLVGKAENAKSSDPDMIERVRITLDPLKVDIVDP